MGAGGSVKRSATSMRGEIERLRERELNKEEQWEKQHQSEELRAEASITQLRNDKYELVEQLRETKGTLKVQTEGWRREKNKTLALMFSDLPLSLLSGGQPSSLAISDASLSKKFPMVTVSQCDVVNFAAMTTRLQAHDVVKLMDSLHALIDEAFSDKDIFVMERTSDGCIAASGLVESPSPEEKERDDGTATPFSMTDSSYGSELDLELGITSERIQRQPQENFASERTQAAGEVAASRPASHYTSLMASAALNLMASSTRIQVPAGLVNKQLQLRISLHSGPCSAGVVGLRTSSGTTRTPHYKLFGPTMKFASNLCSTGLALQIRVSQQCRDLLLKASSGGDFHFERCPDYLNWASRKTVESYWLVGREGLLLKMPSLDTAISLSQYDDIDV